MVRMLVSRSRPGLDLAPDGDLPVLDGRDRLVLPVCLVVRESS